MLQEQLLVQQEQLLVLELVEQLSWCCKSQHPLLFRTKRNLTKPERQCKSLLSRNSLSWTSCRHNRNRIVQELHNHKRLLVQEFHNRKRLLVLRSMLELVRSKT
ncbi:MAG: hypothetical protein ACOVLE_14050 [Pirellula staleyi]